MLTNHLKLFWRLMVRPLAKEPVRIALTVMAVALGVAVVLAIDLASDAATGSFHSSLETLSGDQTFEVTATGGVPEELVGTLLSQPYDWTISPRIESYAVIAETKTTLPLLGIDLIAEGTRLGLEKQLNSEPTPSPETTEAILERDSIWVGESLGKRAGDRLTLLINDRAAPYTVRGTFPDGGEPAIVMDIAAAQVVLGKRERVDRIFIREPSIDTARANGDTTSLETWRHRVQICLPEGVSLRAAGASTEENRKMLAAFRWNLRLLSYVALVVGALLIYNTISVSVVRRRADIGIARAFGAGPAQVLGAFLCEAAAIGMAGSAIGIPLGRLMADGALRLMGATVNALYVSSRPGEVALRLSSVGLALLVGIGVSLLSAWSPAREASRVAPLMALARGQRDFAARVHKNADLAIAVILAAAAVALSRIGPINGKPVFGYCAALLAIASAVLAIPAIVAWSTGASARTLTRFLGVESLLAARGLAGSLRRTSVLVAALCTAVAMMTAVAIMVGSFRKTVVLWMDSQLPADLYIRPAGSPAVDQHPLISIEFSNATRSLPGIRAVQALRAYEISYQGMPATLGSMDLEGGPADHRGDFLSGRTESEVVAELRDQDSVLVSEPFSYKHHVKRGDTLPLTLGARLAEFRVADVYFDYSSERGMVLLDRNVMLKYLPDQAVSNMAVFLTSGTNARVVRKEIDELAAKVGTHVLVFSNADLRAQAVQIFDRTFSITYALEAIAVLVAVMGVAGALLALVIDRRREMGLLRYLGASSRQIRQILLTEAGLLGVLANLCGFGLGFFLSLILIFVVNKQSFGWTIQFHWPLAVLIGANALVWLATLLAGIYPANVAARFNPVEVVHEE